MNVTAAKHTAWQAARQQGRHMVVIQRDKALVHFPLADLQIRPGDTTLALVSPYSDEPTTQPEASE